MLLISIALFLLAAQHGITDAQQANDADQPADIDPNGYLTYCPCMGRFGNQADHFLGTLRFAQRLNRTLILPPWVEYRTGHLRSHQVPFDRYFNITHLQRFHRVRTMAAFMRHEASAVWPPGKRISFCYTARQPIAGASANAVTPSPPVDCNAKDGNPFGPFWDEHSIDFVASQFYGPLSYDLAPTVRGDQLRDAWTQRYPADQWPVLAFTGAPAAFPVQPQNRALQRHLRWTDERAAAARQFIRSALPRGAFIGIHLRNGPDWVRACEHIRTSPNLFAAAQCLGYRNERGNLTRAMCLPGRDVIVRKLKRLIKESRDGGDQRRIRSVFVATDSDHMLATLGDALHRMRVSVHRYAGNDPHLDLAVLGQANHFVGNCVSSFSAFVVREREVSGFPSSFWAFPEDRRTAAANKNRDEL